MQSCSLLNRLIVNRNFIGCEKYGGGILVHRITKQLIGWVFCGNVSFWGSMSNFAEIGNFVHRITCSLCRQ